MTTPNREQPQLTNTTMTDTKLLTEFMEKYGKRLNDEEKTLGDEIVMWMTQAIQLAKAKERKRFASQWADIMVSGGFIRGHVCFRLEANQEPVLTYQSGISHAICQYCAEREAFTPKEDK